MVSEIPIDRALDLGAPHRWRDEASPSMTLAAWVAGVLITVLRRPTAFTQPALWAEDAPEFLHHGVNDGWRSFGQSYNGYLHSAPRLIAWIATFLPFGWTPVVYAGASVLVAVGCCSFVLSGRIAWLFPGRTSQFGCFALLLLLPRINEFHATLTGTVVWCGIALMLILLCDDPDSRRGKCGEIALVVGLVLSGANGMLLLPFIGVRWWRTRSRHSLSLSVAWSAAAFVQFAVLVHGARPAISGELPQAPSLARWALERVVGSLFISGRFVDDPQHLMTDWPLWATGLVVLIAVAVAVLLISGLRPSTLFLLAGATVLSLAGGFWTLGSLARALPERYCALPFAAVIVGISAAQPAAHGLVSSSMILRPLKVLRITLLIWISVSRVTDFVVPARTVVPWAPVVECVEARRSHCVVHANPSPAWVAVVDASGESIP